MATSGNDYATVIGKDATFKGELSFEGGVKVDGTFEGAIQTSGNVLVSKSGTLKAEIQAGNITVDGTVAGNLAASERIELSESCKLNGDIKATRLLVKEGATFVGRCEVGGSLPKATQKDTNSKAIADAAAGKK